LDRPTGGIRPLENAGPQLRSVAGRELVFDSEGFLLDPREWTEDVAEELARESGLTVLTETHWRVIRFLRQYFSENGRAPLHRQLKAGTGLSIMEIESLFPGGTKQGARRLAGLPNPRSCGA
jgi:dissimilatory sulfite reductase related protein